MPVCQKKMKQMKNKGSTFLGKASSCALNNAKIWVQRSQARTGLFWAQGMFCWDFQLKLIAKGCFGQSVGFLRELRISWLHSTFSKANLHASAYRCGLGLDCPARAEIFQRKTELWPQCSTLPMKKQSFFVCKLGLPNQTPCRVRPECIAWVQSSFQEIRSHAEFPRKGTSAEVRLFRRETAALAPNRFCSFFWKLSCRAFPRAMLKTYDTESATLIDSDAWEKNCCNWEVAQEIPNPPPTPEITLLGVGGV